MEWVKHPSCNLVLGAPQGWCVDELPVGALPVTTGEEGGVPVLYSYWRPCAAELAALQQGGLVRLTVVGGGMPPVGLGVIAGAGANAGQGD